MNSENTPLAAMIAAMLGGQQQQEHITYNVQTQVIVPTLQFFGAWFGLTITLLGSLALLGLGFFWTVQQFTGTADHLLISALLVTGAFLLRIVERILVARLDLNPTPWRTMTGFLIRVAILSAMMDVVYALADQWTIRQTIVIVVGLSLVPAGGLLTWRFANELWNPLYPRSPWARLMERVFNMMGTPEPETVQVLRPYPVALNGNLTAAHWQEDEDETDTAADVDPQFRDLIAFLELAQRHGLARDDSATQKGLVTHPRRLLPSGRRLTRPAYDQLTALAAQPWGILEKDDGGGWKWRMDPETALDLLTTVLHQVPAPRQAPRQAGSQGIQYRTAGPSVGE